TSGTSAAMQRRIVIIGGQERQERQESPSRPSRPSNVVASLTHCVMHRVVGVVTARRGSKGIPGKNTKLLAGKPLILYILGAAEPAGPPPAGGRRPSRERTRSCSPASR